MPNNIIKLGLHAAVLLSCFDDKEWIIPPKHRILGLSMYNAICAVHKLHSLGILDKKDNTYKINTSFCQEMGVEYAK